MDIEAEDITEPIITPKTVQNRRIIVSDFLDIVI